MKLSTFIISAALSAAVNAQNSFTINTPGSSVVCQPLLITWAGGAPPYILSVVDGNNPTGAALEELGSQTGTSFTWKVNVNPGKIGLKLIDSTGLTANTAPFDILTGSDTSCVGKTSSGSAAPSSSVSGPASSSSAPVTSTSSSAPATTSSSAPATTSKPASSTTAPATSAPASSSSAAAPNAAATSGVNAGLIGMVGAAALAILA
ncbi:hypothetical protein DL96DRAFT_1288491 [Flagelloscypha sp. PMI_526]|nr:hypothetical protein DL96DRAFT_1288491 [Flagelloscypha sp. PMI_526]